MLDPVGSTSWPNRHLSCFQHLNQLLLREAIVRPVVLIVGPGGVTRAAAWLLNNGAVQHTSRPRKLIGDLARYADQALRRIPAIPLRSLEPAEVDSVLTMPHRLIVVDRSRRVLSAVARDLPNAECRLLDVASQPLPEVVDVLIAFNVVCRLDEPSAGMAHIAKAVRPGGWLLIDDRSAAAYLKAAPQFVQIAPKTYHRKPHDEA